MTVSTSLEAQSSAATSATGTIPGAVRSTLAFVPVTVKDAEASTQWHFSMLGDVEALWSDFTGKGISVGVYDSGIQYAHWDLAANYDASKHVVVGGFEYDGDFHPAAGPHGTAVAGIIAATHNGRETVGIAHEASLTGVNIFNPYSEGGAKPGIFVNAQDKTKFYDAMRQSGNFDVVNHSWGGRSAYGSAASRDVEGTFSWNMTEAFIHVAATGRNGLGTISVNAAGNTIIGGQGSLDDQTDGWKSDRHVITVGAYRGTDGSSTFYSTQGAHLLISAPSGEVGPFEQGKGISTTDLLGSAGYNLRAKPGVKVDYTDAFSGTSAASPIVAGVVTLMLDANEGLGWRDVSNIVAASAKMPVAFATGQTFATALSDSFTYQIEKGKDYILNSSSFRLGGADANWNGGRMHFSTDYGYGAIDAHAAVRMAEIWGLFGVARTSANEVSADTGTLAVSIVPPNNGAVDVTKAYNDFVGRPAGVDVVVKEDIAAEHVDLTVSFTAVSGISNVSLSNVRFRVTAPDGTSAFVDTFASNTFSTSGPQEFIFGLAAFRGVETQGNWRVEFEGFDTMFPIETTITGLRLKVYGSTVSTDDVHTYTDEVFEMQAIRGEKLARLTLTDNDGGTDWVNAAAVTSDVSLSLTAGQRTTFDGRHAFTLSRDSRVEHAVTGDGDDRLMGNALGNKLFGMRGDDWLNGLAGDDTLFGGQGQDVFAFDTGGASGRDRILDWSAGDRIATSKQLKGADVNGLITVGASALLLLDGVARGDTAELAGQGGAVLQALGNTDGYWWYGFVRQGERGHVDGALREAVWPGAATDTPATAARVATSPATVPDAAFDSAFFLYDPMGDAMSSGAQIYA